MIVKFCRAIVSAVIVVPFLTVSALATVINVTPDDLSWAAGDANSFISGNFARSGNGSLELHGDRTRFFGLGNPFSLDSDIGLFNSLSGFGFDWAVSSASQSLLHPDYTPALRLHIWDNGQRSELIWEGAYNGAYGTTGKDTWYTTGNNDHFYQWVAGIGVTEIYDRTLADWQGLYSDSAYISAISVGAGSSVGNNYLAFADNVYLQLGQGESTTFNFELGATSVPEPSALMLLIPGLMLLGFKRRKILPI